MHPVGAFSHSYSKALALTIAPLSTESSSMSTLSESERERILAAVDAAFEAQVGFLSELVRCVSLR
jgi:acetylornithine deacetylase